MSIYDILAQTCQSLQKGSNIIIINSTTTTPEQIEQMNKVFEDGKNPVFSTTGVDENEFFVTSKFVMPKSVFFVDVHFFVIGVDLEKAQELKPKFIEWLDSYPQPERLAQGPSYIEVGAEIGDQETALKMFALGEALQMWKVITPDTMNITGSMADQLAGRGMVMMSGWRK